MVIGSAIRIRISKEDKICILLRKIAWIELDDEWGDCAWATNTFIFSQYPDDDRAPTLYSCYQSRAPLYMSSDDSEMCYEFMDGDRKVWITEEDLKFFGKEI